MKKTLKCGCVDIHWWDDYLSGVDKEFCKKHQLEEDEIKRLNMIKLESIPRENWKQMNEDFPMYEISSHGNIRKMKNKKVSNLRYGQDVL